MDVKPGYKQTEVGVIPEEWSVMSLESISEKIMVGIASAATHAYREKGVPMFRNQNIKVGHLDDRDLLFVAPEYEVTFKNKRLRPGDLLTMRTGYPGVTAIVPAKYDSSQSFTTLITRPDQSRVESAYLCHLINSEHGQRFFTQSQIGGAQKNVNAGTLRGMPIPLPSVPEQRAIAAALGEMDALLGGLDRLIAKKRDLKQAAMQQLLTGQTRLPGFSGEWEVTRLDELGKCFAGGTPSTTRPDCWGGNVFWLPSGRIQNNTLVAPSDSEITITQRGLSESAAKLIKPFSVLVAITGATCANVALLQFEAAANQSVVAIEPFEKADARFTFYALQMERGQILSRQGGSAQGGVNLKAVKGIEIQCPDHGEQTAIAAVLADMDAALAALEARRDKTRDLKHAMMQELLTGKTRLVKPEAAHA